MAAIVAGLAGVTIAFGERIGVNRGQGWDGETYVRWAADFPNEVLEQGTTVYHAQRVLPSAIVHYAMRAVGAERSLENILLAFQLLAAGMLVAAAVLWARIAHALALRAATAWVGFVALFAGFGSARHALYYPALTDPTAFALGMTVAWGYLERRPVVLWVCAALAAVTWPGLTPVAAVMLVLPRLAEPLPDLPSRWRWWVRGACAALAVAATWAFLGLARHYLAHPVTELGIEKFAAWVPRGWLPVTVPVLAATLLVGWYGVIHQPRLWNPLPYLRTVRWRCVALAVAGIAAIWVARGQWLAAVGTRGPGPTTEQFVCLQVLEALRGPVWGLVHHVVYFGPVVLVALVHARAVGRTIGEWGHAAVLAFAMLVVFVAASESRQWIHLLPLVVAATAVATDAQWTPRGAIVFAVLALAWSKTWLVIGYDAPGDWREFPTQRYFMHLGPWASDTSYAWHGGAALVTAAVIAVVSRRGERGPDRRAGQ